MIPPSVCSTRHREKYDRGLTKIWFALALCLIHFLVPISSGSVGPERIVFILHWEAGSLGFRLASSSRRTTKEWIPNTLKKQVCGNPPETVSRRVYSRETGAFTVLPSPVCPVVFPHGLASTLPVKRRPPSPAVCSGTPLLGQVSPFRRSLFNTVASASSLPLFDHFTAR